MLPPVLLVKLHHLRHAALLRLHDHVGQQKRERLVADQFPGAPHRMAQAQRLLLAGEARLAGQRLQPLQLRQLLVLAALGKRVVELELDVEMVLDDRLVAAGHEDEVLDAGLARLVDHILDHRTVDDRQHLLRHRLRRRQKPRTQSCYRKYCLADSFHEAPSRLFERRPPASANLCCSAA